MQEVASRPIAGDAGEEGDKLERLIAEDEARRHAAEGEAPESEVTSAAEKGRVVAEDAKERARIADTWKPAG